MKTELIILTSIAGVYQSSGNIDLYDDTPISLNYSIADIKEPDKRNADYSKTVTVPGTNNNNHLLSNIFEIGIDRLYNPNKKVEARILYDKITVMKGFLRLMKIRILKDKKIEYDFEIKGRMDDLFTNIKDKKLTDLTWSDLNHTWNKTNIKASWSATVGSNYVYPFIDFGLAPPQATNWVWGFRPAIYVKEIWDRIFSYAGFQYESTFLIGNFFKRLIIPFNSEKYRLTDTQIENRELRTSRVTSNQTINVPNFAQTFFDVIFNDDSTSPNRDVGASYNTTTGIYTVPATGQYFISLTINTIKDTSSSNKCTIYFQAKNLTTNAVLGISNQVSLTVGSQTNTFILTTNSFFATAGDQIKIQMSGIKIQGSSIDVDIKTGSYFQVQPVPDYHVGDTISFSDAVPQKIKMSEFLLAIIKMFNLYIEYDKDTPNKMKIEPRNDFYNSTLQDWSKKLDTSKELEILPMGALDAKRYILRYKKDNDWLNSLYQDTYGQGTDSTYGERVIDTDNDFLKNDNVMESIFSPTPLWNDPTSDRVFPRIIKVDNVTQVVNPMQANIRILYYGGLKNCDTWTFYDYVVTNPSTETQYPYCGHLDDVVSPTIDLSFGVPKEVYYIPAWNANYTNNNLYNKYWRQMIEEITDYNSSIVTGWFYLTPSDIAQVDFKHIYRFNNQHFRLNKIYDYNPSALSLTKCEFIKMKVGRAFTAKTKLFRGGNNSVFALQGAPPN